jgi:hypothetical protein
MALKRDTLLKSYGHHTWFIWQAHCGSSEVAANVAKARYKYLIFLDLWLTWGLSRLCIVVDSLAEEVMSKSNMFGTFMVNGILRERDDTGIVVQDGKRCFA